MKNAHYLLTPSLVPKRTVLPVKFYFSHIRTEKKFVKLLDYFKICAASKLVIIQYGTTILHKVTSIFKLVSRYNFSVKSQCLVRVFSHLTNLYVMVLHTLYILIINSRVWYEIIICQKYPSNCWRQEQRLHTEHLQSLQKLFSLFPCH